MGKGRGKKDEGREEGDFIDGVDWIDEGEVI